MGQPERQEFQKILENLRKVGVPFAAGSLNPNNSNSSSGNNSKAPNSTGESPDVAEQRARDQLKDTLKNLTKAVQNNDAERGVPAVKQAVDNARDLVNKLRESAALPDQEEAEAQRKLNAAGDIERILPNFVKSAKAVVRKEEERRRMKEEMKMEKKEEVDRKRT